MQFIINQKMLSIPPYVSTSWESICSLHIESNTLIITLHNSSTIRIPNLSQDILTKIFQTHSQVLSTESNPQNPPPPADQSKLFNFENIMGLGFPMRFGGNLEGLGAAMQHNPEQSNAPELPKEVLEKIAAVAKIMDNDQNLTQGLKPEPHCNCVHCQIAKAITGVVSEDTIEEEEVSDEELQFRDWDIAQSGDKLYIVSNPTDQDEQYNVYLGSPLGCTCGEKNCEHIKAVLNT